MALHEGRPQLAVNVLSLTKALDQRSWHSRNPLRQLNSRDCNDFIDLVGEKFDPEELKSMTAEKIGKKHISDKKYMHSIGRSLFLKPSCEILERKKMIKSWFIEVFPFLNV